MTQITCSDQSLILIAVELMHCQDLQCTGVKDDGAFLSCVVFLDRSTIIELLVLNGDRALWCARVRESKWLHSARL
jgi:hypothetical protein